MCEINYTQFICQRCGSNNLGRDLESHSAYCIDCHQTPIIDGHLGLISDELIIKLSLPVGEEDGN